MYNMLKAVKCWKDKFASFSVVPVCRCPNACILPTSCILEDVGRCCLYLKMCTHEFTIACVSAVCLSVCFPDVWITAILEGWKTPLHCILWDNSILLIPMLLSSQSADLRHSFYNSSLWYVPQVCIKDQECNISVLANRKPSDKHSIFELLSSMFWALHVLTLYLFENMQLSRDFWPLKNNEKSQFAGCAVWPV